MGGPGSGKTGLLARLAADFLGQGGAPDRLAVVARTPAGAVELERRIEGQLQGAHLRPPVRTHERLAAWVMASFAEGGPERPQLDQPRRWLAMARALERARAALPRLAELVGEPSLVDDALSVVSACKRALVGPGLLAERLAGAPASLAELAVISASYDRVLAEMEAADPLDRHDLALGLLLADRRRARGWGDLLLVDEAEDLSPAQWHLLRELQQRMRGRRRMVLAGDERQASQGLGGVASESSSRPFQEYFPQELHPQEWVLPEALGGPIARVGAALLGMTEPPAEALPEAAFRLDPEVRIWEVENGTQEGLAVGREILRGCLAHECDLTDVAVLVPASPAVHATVVAALASLGLPLAEERPVWTRHPLVTTSTAWLGVLADPADPARLLRALACGPDALAPAALRELRRSAARRGGNPASAFWALGQWRAPDGDGPEPGAQGTAQLWARLRGASRSWSQVRAEFGGAPERLTPGALTALLGEVAQRSGWAIPLLTDQEAAGALRELLQAALAILDGQMRLDRQPPRMDEWLKRFEAWLRQPRAGLERGVGRPGAAVAVLSLRQAKGRHWRRVFICGCAAGMLPRPPDPGGLLDSEEVAELVRRLPELEDLFAPAERRLEAEARRFLVGLTRATELVVCTRARRYERDLVEGSRYLELLRSQGVPEVPAPRPTLVSRDDVRVQLALSPAPDLPAEMATAALELRAQLAPWDPVADGAARIEDPLRLSASSLREWLACPRQYLGRHLATDLGPSLSANLGTEAHRLLELMYQSRQAWAGQPGLFVVGARALIEQRLLPEIRAGGAQPLEALYARLWLLRLVDLWAERVVAPGPALVGEPVAQEVAFDLDRGHWRLRGKVDAVWRHPGGEVEIVDYKTGKPASMPDLHREVFGADEKGPTNWQLPIYRMAAERGVLGEAVEGRPPLVRNWYLGAEPPSQPDPPARAVGFTPERVPMKVGSRLEELSAEQLRQIETQLEEQVGWIRQGHFSASPRHDSRTCLSSNGGCAYSFWCDGEASVGADLAPPPPRP